MGSVLRAKYGCQIDILDAFVIIEAPLAVLGSCVFSMHLPVLAKGRVPKKKYVFLMVFCQTGGGVGEGSKKTILLF